MPGTMFQEVVCPRGDAERKWYTLPLSFLIHTVVVAILILVPLLAPDVFPVPRALLNYIEIESPVSAAIAPPPSRQIAHRDAVLANSDAAPIDVPTGIGRETGLDISIEPIAGNTDGLVDGFGGGQGIIDAPPPVHEAREAVEQPRRVSGGLKPPTRIRDVPPVYPEIARSARVQGVVILEAIIGADGHVQQARILRSVPLLDQAAVNAVQSWEYTPTLLDGRAVPIIMTVTVVFKLE